MEKGPSSWGNQVVFTIATVNSGIKKEKAEDENQRKEKEGEGLRLERFLPLIPLLIIITIIITTIYKTIYSFHQKVND